MNHARKQASVICHKLPPFAPEALDSIKAAFQHTAPIPARQAWRKKPETDFAPMYVRIGWREDTLLVFAELEDNDVFTSALANNQRLWELGDVFEIFLRPNTKKSYVELQVAPNNRWLQLGYPDAQAVTISRKLGVTHHLLIHGKMFLSSTWICAADHKWFVFAEIPARAVGENARLLAGVEWLFSFSRYDYTRGRRHPVISSTSPHQKPDFHRHAEWRMLHFEDGLK